MVLYLNDALIPSITIANSIEFVGIRFRRKELPLDLDLSLIFLRENCHRLVINAFQKAIFFVVRLLL